MSWLDVHFREMAWAGIVAFLAAFWTAFGMLARWVLS